MAKTTKEILAEIESIIDSHCRSLPFHDLVDFDLNLKFKPKEVLTHGQ